tara:strand:+ start:3455 stop:3652 length:198 start_codon:yes stop_codon:yes gene_type:complete
MAKFKLFKPDTLKKGDKIFFDEVGRGRVKGVFMRREGSDAIVREVRKKRGIIKDITLISPRRRSM